MKSKFLFVFLFLGILNCEAQHFNAIPYDYLQLALRWPNSYCLTHEGGCREIVPQYFTISYLHPMRRGGPDLQNCPSPFNMPNSTVSISCIPIHFLCFVFLFYLPPPCFLQVLVFFFDFFPSLFLEVTNDFNQFLLSD